MSKNFTILEIGSESYKYADINIFSDIEKLPFSYRILLENVLRQKINNHNSNADDQINNIFKI